MYACGRDCVKGEAICCTLIVKSLILDKRVHGEM
jgi:hypothetical protein